MIGCVTNSDCWYVKYFEIISDTVEIDDTINAEGLNEEDYITVII